MVPRCGGAGTPVLDTVMAELPAGFTMRRTGRVDRAEVPAVVQLSRRREHPAAAGAGSDVPCWASIVMSGAGRIRKPVIRAAPSW